MFSVENSSRSIYFGWKNIRIYRKTWHRIENVQNGIFGSNYHYVDYFCQKRCLVESAHNLKALHVLVSQFRSIILFYLRNVTIIIIIVIIMCMCVHMCMCTFVCITVCMWVFEQTSTCTLVISRIHVWSLSSGVLVYNNNQPNLHIKNVYVW